MLGHSYEKVTDTIDGMAGAIGLGHGRGRYCVTVNV